MEPIAFSPFWLSFFGPDTAWSVIRRKTKVALHGIISRFEKIFPDLIQIGFTTYLLFFIFPFNGSGFLPWNGSLFHVLLFNDPGSVQIFIRFWGPVLLGFFRLCCADALIAFLGGTIQVLNRGGRWLGFQLFFCLFVICPFLRRLLFISFLYA